ncbi:MAG: hypothetical protein ACREDC_07210, partial [Bradyrhizobium sp.]
LISLSTAIGQVTYAFGPGVLGLLRDLSGSYSLPFSCCIALEVAAAALIMAPVISPAAGRRGRDVW